MLDLAFQLGPSALFLYVRRTQFRNLLVARRDHVSSLDRTPHGSNGYSPSNLTTCATWIAELELTSHFLCIYGGVFDYASYVGQGVRKSEE